MHATNCLKFRLSARTGESTVVREQDGICDVTGILLGLRFVKMVFSCLAAVADAA